MEYFDVVDRYGNPTGETIDRESAHRYGIRHRTSHLWLLRRRENGIEVLLQKRSSCKDSHPGCYDISSAGHIPAGSEFVASAIRELQEELGLYITPSQMILCGTRQFEFISEFHGQTFHDNQVSRVFAAWMDVAPESLTLQSSEVESVIWMEYDSLVDAVANNTIPHCIYLEELALLSHAWDPNTQQ